MATIKQGFQSTVDASIAQKTSDYSVAKTDVSNRLLELADFLGALPVNASLYYSKGWFVYTESPFAIYVSINENVIGNVSNSANWLKVAGSGLPYLVSSTDVSIAVVPYQPSDYYVSKTIPLATASGALFDLNFTGVAATNTRQLAYSVNVDTTGAADGSSVFIRLDNKGVGMARLLVNGVQVGRMASGSLYMFTKTSDVDDSDGHILTKMSSFGVRSVGSGSEFTCSPGKYIVPPSGAVALPLAAGLNGEVVELVLLSAGSVTVTATSPDTIVNVGSYSYNMPVMRFMSDGIDKWYYID